MIGEIKVTQIEAKMILCYEKIDKQKMYTNVICYAEKERFFLCFVFCNFFLGSLDFFNFFGFCVSYESNHKKNNLNS